MALVILLESASLRHSYGACDDLLARTLSANEPEGEGGSYRLDVRLRFLLDCDLELTSVNSGNTVIIGSTVSILLALTWAGLQFAWNSPQVLAPLIIGGVGIAVFGLIEVFVAKHPTVRCLKHSACLILNHLCRCPAFVTKTVQH